MEFAEAGASWYNEAGWSGGAAAWSGCWGSAAKSELAKFEIEGLALTGGSEGVEHATGVHR